MKNLSVYGAGSEGTQTLAALAHAIMDRLDKEGEAYTVTYTVAGGESVTGSVEDRKSGDPALHVRVWDQDGATLRRTQVRFEDMDELDIEL